MSKRNATGSRLSRKRRKGGASYKEIDLDSLGDRAPQAEVIRVWKTSRSETTGRVSGTRKNHKLFYEGPSKPSRKEQPSAMEDISAPADPELSGQLPAEPTAKRKKSRTTKNKENDSVSFVSILSSKLILTHQQTKMEDWRARHRSIVLDELLRGDGLGDSATPGTCISCGKLPGEYRCSDCFGDIMRCLECTVSSHRHLPLHRLQVCSELPCPGYAAESFTLGLGGWLLQMGNPREPGFNH